MMERITKNKENLIFIVNILVKFSDMFLLVL